MNASQEDIIAMKAEARRKKILENAQKRLEKVLSKTDVSYRHDLGDNLTKSELEEVTKSLPLSDLKPHQNNSIASPEDPPLEEIVPNILKTPTTKINHVSSTNSLSSPAFNSSPNGAISQSAFLESLSKGTNPLLPMAGSPDEFDFTKHLNLLENTIQPPSLGTKTKNKTLVLLSRLQYGVLAIVVRLMLYFQMGWFFGEMILVPFVLTESVQISLGYINTSPFTQILGQVMALCGFSSQVIQCYSKVNTILLHCVEDFSFYLFTFCIVHNLLDEQFEPR